MNADGTRQGPCEEAFRRFLAHRTMLKSYVSAIVRDHHLAEDTLQDVAIQIAKSWGTFDPTRDFGAWARGIARRVALRNIHNEKRVPILLSEDALEQIGGMVEAAGSESEMDRRKEALRACLESLPERGRQLIVLRYFQGTGYAEMSRLLKRSEAALYTALSRFHEQLEHCIRKRMAQS